MYPLSLCTEFCKDIYTLTFLHVHSSISRPRWRWSFMGRTDKWGYWQWIVSSPGLIKWKALVIAKGNCRCPNWYDRKHSVYKLSNSDRREKHFHSTHRVLIALYFPGRQTNPIKSNRSIRSDSHITSLSMDAVLGFLAVVLNIWTLSWMLHRCLILDWFVLTCSPHQAPHAN